MSNQFLGQGATTFETVFHTTLYYSELNTQSYGKDSTIGQGLLSIILKTVMQR